jgi:hypothetical protein
MGNIIVNNVIVNVNRLKDNLTVYGDLDFQKPLLFDNFPISREEVFDFVHEYEEVVKLPNNLTVTGNLKLNLCTNLIELPTNLTVGGDLELAFCKKIKKVPDCLKVSGRLHLYNCINLVKLPDNLVVNDYLYLRGCDSLCSLPNNLTVNGDLNLLYCPNLNELPETLQGDGIIMISKDMKDKLYIPEHLKHKVEIGF